PIHELVFVDQTWPLALQDQSRVDRGGGACGPISVQTDFGSAQGPRRRGLPYSLGPGDEDRAVPPKLSFQHGFDDAWSVHGHGERARGASWAGNLRRPWC